MELEHLHSQNFNEKISQNGLVVVDFFATWCGPCRMLGPVMEEVQDELTSSVSIYKVDIDEEESIARSFGIMSVPSVLFFKDGKEIGRFVGYRNKEQALEEIAKYM